VLFSDGVTEAENLDQELFEVSGLCKALEGKDGMAVDAIEKSVLEAVQEFTRGAHQSDDITLLVVRYRAAV